MKLLIIGGSCFVGAHLVQAALAAGHAVTVFNRGQTAGAVPAGVHWLQGDRRGDLAPLQAQARAQGGWDAVIDCFGYLPDEVDRMAQVLDAQVGRYAFISSISVYPVGTEHQHEAAPLATLPAGADATQVTGETYGPLKAACEAALQQRLGARALLLRPGLVVGPLDPTGRFSWWPARLARAALDGQPVLAPGAPQRPLQFIDARDLADFTLQAVAAAVAGPVNVVAPPGFTTMAGLLQACARAAGLDPVAVPWCWLDDATLLAHEVAPWTGLPLCLPAEGETAHFMACPNQRAQALGLQLRPLAQTVADTLAWWRSLPAERQGFASTGLAPEREAALCALAAAAPARR